MEQTCPQKLHFRALCQFCNLLGAHRQFRHHRNPWVHTDRHAGAPNLHANTNAHVFSKVFPRWVLITCRRPPGCYSAKHVKCPAELRKPVPVPSSSQTQGSESETASKQAPDASLVTTLIFAPLALHSCGLHLGFCLYITFQLLRRNGHCSHQLARPNCTPALRCAD